jgi:hypothetical protein
MSHGYGAVSNGCGDRRDAVPTSRCVGERGGGQCKGYGVMSDAYSVMRNIYGRRYE